VLGTRLIASRECNAHPVYKQRVLAATEQDTVRTTLFGHGWPNAWHRTLRTHFVDQWLSEEARGSQQRPDEPVIGEMTLGGMRFPVRRFGGVPPASDTSGEIESMALLCGQSAGLVREIQPAAEILREVVQEAERILQRLSAGR
jgi:NAD(P)H-dependent flavin oxidoreductase YrpB (nitropropane dioxygenase family)